MVVKMTHQSLLLGKCLRLFWATLRSEKTSVAKCSAQFNIQVKTSEKSLFFQGYSGLQSNHSTDHVKSCVCNLYSLVNLKIMPSVPKHTPHQISLLYKDRLNRSQMSKVIYKAGCWDCNELYSGKKRWLHDRKTVIFLCYRSFSALVPCFTNLIALYPAKLHPNKVPIKETIDGHLLPRNRRGHFFVIFFLKKKKKTKFLEAKLALSTTVALDIVDFRPC